MTEKRRADRMHSVHFDGLEVHVTAVQADCPIAGGQEGAFVQVTF